ncbi:exo-alpha-sialidase [Ramlibacter sp. WS9]|uniref:WD40/YVTN/BNR-like repeat-containing protein n=1 Tax=Ramlibacter sp. WS9 TaxID=1882741 RepID=UPI001143C16A|nr:exo-alpha-sialidase [Ramlibacter sp. WS9]ROZ77044.1 exo-alpha-sialidase [Ramlibacter sp. WS9]
MQTLWVGTRKGLFRVRQDDAGWHIGAPSFPGEPVSQFAASPHDGACYAALRLGHFGVKLWKSVDGGSEWKEIAAPAFPPKPTEGPWKDDETPWTVDQVWALEAAPDGRLWAGCLPAGLFSSRDGGASWQLVSSLWERPERREWFGGGYDWAGIHSVLVDPRDANHVTVAISCGGVWQSRDGGASWTNTSAGMVADFMPPERREDPNIQDAHRVVQCMANPDVLWCQHHGGIFRSANGGLKWDAIADPRPSGFGFAVAAHPLDAQRAWFVPAHSDAQRVAPGGRMVVTQTRDGGATFSVHGDGLPQQDAYHLVYRHSLAVSRDGRTLAMGSTTGGLWVSDDAGDTWQCLSRDLPPIAVVRLD